VSAVSSAKRKDARVVKEGRSLMYMRKSRGPRIEPCGTPVRIERRVLLN